MKTLGNVLSAVFSVLGAVLILGLSVLLIFTWRVFLGALTGFLAGVFFSSSFTNILVSAMGTGMATVEIWQFGAFMGFLSGFWQTSVFYTLLKTTANNPPQAKE